MVIILVFLSLSLDFIRSQLEPPEMMEMEAIQAMLDFMK